MVGETCKIVLGEEVKNKLLEGSKETAQAVSTTFGPYGRNVAITMKYNVPKITKDGASVAGFIKLEDPIKNVAAQIINQAANETAKVAGDGTTSTTVLTAKLIELAYQLINENERPMRIAKDLEFCLPEVLNHLASMSTPVQDSDIYNIAIVACNGDAAMATMVTEAFKVVGKNGLVSVLDSKNYDTVLDTTQGIRLDRTHILPILANGKTTTKHNDCAIACLDLDVTSSKEAIYLIQLQESLQKPLLVICNDLTGSAAEVIAYNKSQHNIDLEFIRAPFIADARKEALYDLACVAGATLLSKAEGWEVSNLNENHLGSSDSVEITLRETNILGRKGKPELIEERIKYYETKISEDKDGLAENYKKRLAFFTSGAAVIYVGGANESEVDEKKDRFDDTIRAVRSALAEGFVPGGGLTYLQLRDYINTTFSTTGSTLLANALNSIPETILENSGIITQQEHTSNVTCLNIIDPTLVVSATLKNAIGAAIMVFTTGCVVVRHET